MKQKVHLIFHIYITSFNFLGQNIASPESSEEKHDSMHFYRLVTYFG